jgi:hypothetical protein
MNKKPFFAGIASLAIAICLALLNLTKLETSFGENIPTTIKIYPAAFFALVGLLLFFYGIRPLWRN